MRRYSYSVFATAILLVTAAVAAAQVGQLRGQVFLQQADGTKVPVEGALIDIYRTDLKGKYEAKTNKSGEFVHAGLPYVGTYTLAASAPKAAPTVRSGAKAGRDINFELIMSPGDGRRYTEEEVRSGKTAETGNSNAAAAANSEAEKARQAEIAKIAEENKKIDNANQVIGDSFKAGNAAYSAKNYDEAIRLYDTGLAVDPDHPGIPVLLRNKSIALRMRGANSFNAAAQSKDEAARTAGMEAAKADFKASAEAATKAVELLKKQPASTDPVQAKQTEANKYDALSSRAESMRLYVSKVDSTKVDDGITAYQEYMAAEPDPLKKAKAQRDLAQMLFDAGAHEKAKIEYEKILTEKPDDPDALASMGMILYSMGFMKDSEGKKDEAKALNQQAANYLQTFVDKAPDTHQLKAGAKEVLDALKAQNVQAEKPAARPRPGRRP